MPSTDPGTEPNGTIAVSDRLRAGLVLRLFVPFAAGYYLSYVFRTVNAVAAPNLVADTGLGADALGFLTSMYLAAFAVLQLPVGILLDRFGPRRVEAALLMLAAAGSVVFAFSDGLSGLAIGRALIGVGVSCCMMASFKAFAMWFAPHRLPSIYACLLAFGALGAISATVPVEWFLGLLDWRTLFIALGLFAVAVSLAVFTIVPDYHEAPGHTTFADQLRGLGFVFRDRFFLGIAPLAAVSSGTSLAINGLWAGPWLRDVAGFGRDAVAVHLLTISASMGVGFLALGLLTERLTRLGLRPVTIAAGGMAAFMLMVAILAVGITGPALWPLLVGLGFLATSGSLSYSLVSRHFGRHLAGRANTAQNVLVFVAAFVIQWAIGGVLSGWEDPVTHRYDPAGYRIAFAGTVVVQAIALVWFLRQYAVHGQREPGEPPVSATPVAAEEGDAGSVAVTGADTYPEPPGNECAASPGSAIVPVHSGRMTWHRASGRPMLFPAANRRPSGAYHAGTRTAKTTGHIIMAKGFGDEDDVHEQIESTINDEVQRARSALPEGESLTHCEECDRPIPEARRQALPGVRLCVACQEAHDREHGHGGLYNRRGSKDSQLR